MGAEEQRQVVGIEIMRKKPQGVGQRKGNLERTGQRVKARGHRVMGSRGWVDGLRETQGTKPAQKLDGLRHMEIELRGESQTQGPRGPRESSWTWPQEREAEVEVGMRPTSSRAPAYSGLRPGQRKWRRAGGGGVNGSWPQGLAMEPNLLWVQALWLCWEERESQSWGLPLLLPSTPWPSPKGLDLAPL